MDSTIETLEIVIKARVDEAIKGIRKVTDAVQQEVAKCMQDFEKFDKVKVDIKVSKVKEKIKEVKNELEELKDTEINLNIKNYDIKELGNNIRSIVTSSDTLKNKFASLGAELYNVGGVMKQNIGEAVRHISSQLDEVKSDIKNKINGAFTGLGGAIKSAPILIGKSAGKGLVKGFKASLGGIKTAVKGAFSKVGDSVSSTLNKGLSSIKRFTLGLFGIRSAMRIVSQATSSYLSFDKQLNDSIQNSWNVLGSLLAPVLELVANLFAKATSYVASFVKALTGIDLVARANAKGIQSQTKATKDQAKANKQLAGIDDISSLNSNDSGSGAGGDFTPITSDNVDISLFDGIISKIKEAMALITNGDWNGLAQLISTAITTGLDSVSNWIQNINVEPIANAINGIFGNLDYSGILTGIVNVFGEAVLKFEELFLAIDWANIIGKFSRGLANAIGRISEYIDAINWSSIGTKLSDTFYAIDWEGIFENIVNLLWEALKGIVELLGGIDWGKIATTISSGLKVLIDTITSKLKSVDWAQLGSDIIEKIWDFLSNFDWLGLLVSILNLILTALESLGNLIIGAVGKLLKTLWDSICSFFGVHSPSTKFSDLGNNILAGLLNGLKNTKDKVVAIFTTAWNGIKSVFSKVGTFFSDTFSKAWTKVKDIFSKGGKIFSGITEGISSMFKKIVNTLIDGINKVVATPFNKINDMLNKIRDVGIPGAKPFKGLFSKNPISVPKIPKLATGNVATETTLAVFGEYSGAKTNPEITAPQKTMENSFRKVLQEQMGNENQHITINVAGKNFFDEVINYINDKSERNGVSVIKEV